MEVFILDFYQICPDFMLYSMTFYVLIGLTADFWRISAPLDTALHLLVDLLESSMCLVLTNLQARRKVITAVVSVSILLSPLSLILIIVTIVPHNQSIAHFFLLHEFTSWHYLQWYLQAIHSVTVCL